jgi:hypothetical protein
MDCTTDPSSADLAVLDDGISTTPEFLQTLNAGGSSMAKYERNLIDHQGLTALHGYPLPSGHEGEMYKDDKRYDHKEKPDFEPSPHKLDEFILSNSRRGPFFVSFDDDPIMIWTRRIA